MIKSKFIALLYTLLFAIAYSSSSYSQTGQLPDYLRAEDANPGVYIYMPDKRANKSSFEKIKSYIQEDLKKLGIYPSYYYCVSVLEKEMPEVDIKEKILDDLKSKEVKYILSFSFYKVPKASKIPESTRSNLTQCNFTVRKFNGIYYWTTLYDFKIDRFESYEQTVDLFGKEIRKMPLDFFVDDYSEAIYSRPFIISKNVIPENLDNSELIFAKLHTDDFRSGYEKQYSKKSSITENMIERWNIKIIEALKGYPFKYKVVESKRELWKYRRSRENFVLNISMSYYGLKILYVMTLVSLEETKSNTYYILHKTIAKKQYGGVTGINIPNAYVETIEKFNAMVVKQYNIK